MIATFVAWVKNLVTPPVLLTLDPNSPRWWETECLNLSCERAFKYRALAGVEPYVHCPHCGEGRDVYPGVVARTWEV